VVVTLEGKYKDNSNLDLQFIGARMGFRGRHDTTLWFDGLWRQIVCNAVIMTGLYFALACSSGDFVLPIMPDSIQSMCEKRMTTTWEQLMSVVKSCHENGVMKFGGVHFRFSAHPRR
jgi:hypothetical protein